MEMSIKNFFDQIWNQYVDLNPEALKIHQLLEKQGDQVFNDHVAYRTLNHPKLGIKSLARFFESYGYEIKSDYHFEVKKLYAVHLENIEKPELPKVFISELLMDKFSVELQQTLNHVVDEIPMHAMDEQAICTAGRLWSANHKTYQKLYSESEYAAWFYAYGFCANHFTVNINNLKAFKEVSDLNNFLIKNGFAMNSSGGLVKGTPIDYLEQSSTMAYEKDIKFEDGSFKVPSCYYEFAKRYKLDNGKYYQGFVAKSADKIFESTNKR
jgi:hypothetical protein